MRLFTIPKGTSGKLVETNSAATADVTRDWVTRRELLFTECVTDPVKHHNNRGTTLPHYISRLAEQGYAVYGGEYGGDFQSKYLLAVPFDDVKAT